MLECLQYFLRELKTSRANPCKSGMEQESFSNRKTVVKCQILWHVACTTHEDVPQQQLYRQEKPGIS